MAGIGVGREELGENGEKWWEWDCGGDKIIFVLWTNNIKRNLRDGSWMTSSSGPGRGSNMEPCIIAIIWQSMGTAAAGGDDHRLHQPAIISAHENLTLDSLRIRGHN